MACPLPYDSSVFDVDTIDLGPERRAFLEHKLERVWEINSQGSIPYVPYFRAPYYIWIGQHHQTGRESSEPDKLLDRGSVCVAT